MNHPLPKRLASMLRVFLAATCLATPVPSPADDAATDVLATVGDASITRAELSAFLRRTAADRRRADGQHASVVVAAALERLVDEKLLQSAAVAAGIRVETAEVDAAVGQLRSQVQATRGISLEELLASSGGDLAEVRRQIEADLSTAKLIAPRIDAASLATAYRKHRRDIDGTRVRVSHIVLRPDPGAGDEALAATVRKAVDIRAAIVRQDVTFAEAAARHSAAPSRHKGGDLGFLERRGETNEAFVQAAFSMEVGDVSQPLATPQGVHLVTVTTIEAGTVPLETLRPKVEQLAAQDAVRELVASLRKTTRITYSPGVPRAGGTPQGADTESAPRP